MCVFQLWRRSAAYALASGMLLSGAPSAWGAVTSVAARGLQASDLDGSIAANDALHGLIALELPGDNGWHPANPAAANGSLDPAGLPTFTDGIGRPSNVLAGLLNDFPGAGTPTKLLQYDLPAALDVGEIRILTGNANNADGRIFSTTVIRYSVDGGTSFAELGYFQSDPSGAINNESGAPPPVTSDRANLLQIFDDADPVLLSGVTNLQFDFYAVDNTGGQMRDPFDGLNPFTQTDDGLTAAFVSPLVWEIDVLSAAAPPTPDADFNADGFVDGADGLRWQRGFGRADAVLPIDGDANGDGLVDAADLSIWESQFGQLPPAASSVPEPTLFAMLVPLAAFGTKRRRSAEGSLRPNNLPRQSARR